MTASFDIEAFKREVADEVVARLNGDRDDRPLYSAKTLAEKLDVSDRVARQMIQDGVIPSFKIGGLRRVEPAAVDAYLAGQKVAGDA